MLKKYLAKEFEIKDLERLHYFLGIEVEQWSKCFFISPMKYILDLLEIRMLSFGLVDSSIEVNNRLVDYEGEVVEKERYHRLVGRLNYLLHTWPDIAYLVSVISQFIHDPWTSYLDVVNHILQSLNYASSKGFLFSNNWHLKVKAFIDVDWAGLLGDKRSTSRYCAFIGGNLVL